MWIVWLQATNINNIFWILEIPVSIANGRNLQSYNPYKFMLLLGYE